MKRYKADPQDMEIGCCRECSHIKDVDSVKQMGRCEQYKMLTSLYKTCKLWSKKEDETWQKI